MLRLQHCALQTKIIHRARPQEIRPGKARTDTIHQRAARLAEVIRHVIALGGSFIRRENGEVVLSAEPFEVVVRDDEIHRLRLAHFVAVAAVAGKGLAEARRFQRLENYVYRQYFGFLFDGNLDRTRTKDNCTAPQKHVAVASFSLDQPSEETPARGNLVASVGIVIRSWSLMQRSGNCSSRWFPSKPIYGFMDRQQQVGGGVV
jgi:hypothetical protein